MSTRYTIIRGIDATAADTDGVIALDRLCLDARYWDVSSAFQRLPRPTIVQASTKSAVFRPSFVSSRLLRGDFEKELMQLGSVVERFNDSRGTCSIVNIGS